MTDARLAGEAVAVLVLPVSQTRVAGEAVSVLVTAQPPSIRIYGEAVAVLTRATPVTPVIPVTGVVSWWDGAALQSASVFGWWGGATQQPVEAAGWWDGAAIQPFAGAVDYLVSSTSAEVLTDTTGTYNLEAS